MIKQRGQTLVEFALMAPMIFLLIFGMIYGGVMFIDYMNLNNDARALARRIAVADSTAERNQLLEEYTAGSEKTSFKRFYNITMTATYIDKDGNVVTDETIKNKTSGSAEDVKVTVNFNRDNKDLPWVVYKVGFPPENFAITYKMKLEPYRTKS